MVLFAELGMAFTRERERFGRDCEGEEVREGQGQRFKRGVEHARYVEALRGRKTARP